jgi:hypothetical protein
MGDPNRALGPAFSKCGHAAHTPPKTIFLSSVRDPVASRREAAMAAFAKSWRRE